jgi:hypothetical protein
MDDETFYRKLFLRRYALLLEKVERVYAPSDETKKAMKDTVLSLDWIDVGVQNLQGKLRKH